MVLADCPRISSSVVPALLPVATLFSGRLGLIAVLATVTTIQRIYFVYRQSKSDPN